MNILFQGGLLVALITSIFSNLASRDKNIFNTVIKKNIKDLNELKRTLLSYQEFLQKFVNPQNANAKEMNQNLINLVEKELGPAKAKIILQFPISNIMFNLEKINTKESDSNNLSPDELFLKSYEELLKNSKNSNKNEFLESIILNSVLLLDRELQKYKIDEIPPNEVIKFTVTALSISEAAFIECSMNTISNYTQFNPIKIWITNHKNKKIIDKTYDNLSELIKFSVESLKNENNEVPKDPKEPEDNNRPVENNNSNSGNYPFIDPKKTVKENISAFLDSLTEDQIKVIMAKQTIYSSANKPYLSTKPDPNFRRIGSYKPKNSNVDLFFEVNHNKNFVPVFDRIKSEIAKETTKKTESNK